MANITMSAEELVKLMAGDNADELKRIRARMQVLLLDTWVSDTSFKEELETKARELAEKEVERHLARAFSEHTGYGSPKRTFNGWAATIVKSKVDEELRSLYAIHKNDKGFIFERMVRGAITEEIKDQNAAWQKTMDDAKPFIDEQVRALVPKYVTEDFKARVASHFEKNKLEDMVMDIVQKSIGAMLMNGALRVDTLPKDGNQ